MLNVQMTVRALTPLDASCHSLLSALILLTYFYFFLVLVAYNSEFYVFPVQCDFRFDLVLVLVFQLLFSFSFVLVFIIF